MNIYDEAIELENEIKENRLQLTKEKYRDLDDIKLSKIIKSKSDKHDKIIKALERAKKEHELIEELKFQLHSERLWNIQLEQSFDEIKGELVIHDQANVLFDFISENYEQLDSIVARLQKHYNSDTEEYEQQEEDRIVLYNLLELHDDLSKCGGMNKELEEMK